MQIRLESVFLTWKRGVLSEEQPEGLEASVLGDAG